MWRAAQAISHVRSPAACEPYEVRGTVLRVQDCLYPITRIQGWPKQMLTPSLLCSSRTCMLLPCTVFVPVLLVLGAASMPILPCGHLRHGKDVQSTGRPQLYLLIRLTLVTSPRPLLMDTEIIGTRSQNYHAYKPLQCDWQIRNPLFKYSVRALTCTRTSTSTCVIEWLVRPACTPPLHFGDD